MSFIEENVVITPWVGPSCCKTALSVVVLSSNVEIINRIAQALSEVHSKKNVQWKLIILRSFSLEEVVRQSNLTGRIGIDFVIIALDTSKFTCIDYARKALEQVHPDLRRRRVVLVNSSGLSHNSMGCSAHELICLQSDSKIDILTANVFDLDDVTFLAKRLLKYLEVSLGIKTGIPNLNV